MTVNYTPMTWTSGNVVTAAQMNTEVRDLSSGLQAAWTAWTPTVSGGLTVGNGTWTGGYIRVGKTVTARFSFTFGSTSSTTGAQLLFPIAINTGYPAFSCAGTAMLYDTSGGAAGRLTGSVFVVSTATSGVGAFGVVGPTGQQVAAVPFTWAVGDELSGVLTYEAA